MIKLIVSVMLLVSICFTGFALPAADEYVVEGEHPLTWSAIDAQIKIVEFVLQTRLTVRQKNMFLAAIKAELEDIDEQGYENLSGAVELVENLNVLDEEIRTQVRHDLKEQFVNVAEQMPDDPAARLFTNLRTDANQPTIRTEEDNITRQAAMAFVEYLAFVANPDDPDWYGPGALRQIVKSLQENFESLDEDQKAVLDDFQLNWYMVRAGWEALAENPQMRAQIKKTFSDCGITPGEVPSFSSIEKALRTDTYADLLDIAVYSNALPIEWTVGPAFRVW